jgi:diguanylate cyclase (GGDEF)-like protein
VHHYRSPTAAGWTCKRTSPEKRRSEQKIYWLARHDALTEIANRFYFREQLDHALQEIKANDAFAVLWIDLDKFKEVNDTFGHPVGDELLKSVARRLRDSVRGPDLVGRLGGDEFAVLQSNARRKADVERLATRLLHAIGEPHHVSRYTVQVDASIGIARLPSRAAPSTIY